MKIKSDLAQLALAEAAAEDHELTEAEIESFSRESVLAGEEASDPGQYPRMWNVSAGFFNERVVRAHQPQPVEIIAVPHRTVGGVRGPSCQTL